MKKIGLIYYGWNLLKHSIATNISLNCNIKLTSPKKLVLEPTYRCNQRCLMCNNWKLSSNNELKLNEIENLFKQAKKVNIKQIILGGGEPLIRNDIFEIIKMANDYGFVTSMVTNGTLLDQRIIKKLLIDYDLFRIGVSLDGINETHDKLRGMKGAYDKTLRSLVNLSKIKQKYNNKTIIYINTVITNENFREIPKIINIARRLNLGFLCQPVVLFNNKLKEKLWINEGNIRDLEKLIKILKQEKIVINLNEHLNLFSKYFKKKLSTNDFICPIAYEQIGIDAEGNYFNCPIYNRKLENFRNLSIKQFFKSNSYIKSIEITKKCNECLINCVFSSFRVIKLALKYISAKISFLDH